MMPLGIWASSVMLLGLRIAPVFAFAPPFTLVPMPPLFRLLFGLGVSATLVAVHPRGALVPDTNPATLFMVGVREFGLGLTIVLAFQIAFGALYFAGRTVDIQAGFGLATLIDPTSQSQTPMIGTLFAYAAAAMFFALNGHMELLRFFGASVDTIPLGAWNMPHTIERIAAFLSTMFVVALGIAGASILVLFLIDICIAALSRTVPQMNVLILGFQVKTIVLLLVLPASFGAGGTLFIRMMESMLRAIPRIV